MKMQKKFLFFKISVCKAATPLTAKLPTIARFAIRTDLPLPSLIIESFDKIFWIS